MEPSCVLTPGGSEPLGWLWPSLAEANSVPGSSRCLGGASSRHWCWESREDSGKLWPHLSQKYSSTTLTSTSAEGEG